ncbi:hypothetical protein KC316_g5740 [Hortaea werneckii]|nr:hypothetical protein KC324_g2944 [Hortaea werneckii]KAI7586213.1 hypothetical protein KC316_g5740 [Hortaea werneckii]
MPFNWRLQLRLAITNFVVVFIGVLVVKILLTPIGAYFFPANTTDLTSNDGSLSGKGSSLDYVNYGSASTISPEITIGGTPISTPIAATTDAFGRLPDGGKYVELVDKGYSPMHIDLTDGLGELYRVVETVDGQVVYNETFRGEDAEGQYYAAIGNKSLHKRARTQWSPPPMHLMDIWARYCPQGNPWSVSSYPPGQGSAASILAPIKADLETLVVGTQDELARAGSWNFRRHVNMNLKPAGPGAAIMFRQDKRYSQAGHYLEATNAQYALVFNLLDGIIVAHSTFSPGKQLPNQVPPSLEKWSDVTWRCWRLLRSYDSSQSFGYRVTDFRGFLPPPDGSNPPRWINDVPSIRDFRGPMANWLNYIVIQNIKSPQETHEVISYCMDGYTDFDGSPKYVNGKVPLWNDEFTFRIGNICYYALLAIPDCRGIAWFLTQHKERLGSKVPFSVKLWWPTDQGQPVPSIDMPSLLWEIRDANDPELLQEKAEMDQEVDAFGMQPV